MDFSSVIAFAILVVATQAQYYGHPGYLGYGYGAPVAYGGYAGYGQVPVTRLAAAPVAPVPVARAPAAVAPVREDAAYDPNPQYTYSYQVDDPVTGDSKAQTETRQGDVVQGSYTLIEPDGSRRTVDYTADPVSGFNAVVRKDGGVTSAPVAVPVGAPAPVAVARTPVAAAAYRTPLAVNRGPVYVGHPYHSAYGVYGH